MPWPALVLILLMIIPFPRIIKKPILWIVDKILFCKVHFLGAPRDLYWVSMGIIIPTFYWMTTDMRYR